MSQIELFEMASRKKIRFETGSGLLSVEDLWDLPLETTSTTKTSLDILAVTLHNKLEASGKVVSFIHSGKTSAAVSLDTLKFDIVKRILGVKLAEKEASDQARVKASEKQRIMELIESKKGEAMAGKSLEELELLLRNM